MGQSQRGVVLSSFHSWQSFKQEFIGTQSNSHMYFQWIGFNFVNTIAWFIFSGQRVCTQRPSQSSELNNKFDKRYDLPVYSYLYEHISCFYTVTPWSKTLKLLSFLNDFLCFMTSDFQKFSEKIQNVDADVLKPLKNDINKVRIPYNYLDINKSIFLTTKWSIFTVETSSSLALKLLTN